MVVTRVTIRDIRSHAQAFLAPGPGLTVLHGANGAGKTNLLEALFVGCTGRSFRAAGDRELVRFGASVGRVEVRTQASDGTHTIAVGIEPGAPKTIKIDGAPVERLLDAPGRPLVSVFVPDRLELVKGAPAARRGHLDQVVAALWPARAATRRAYGQTLAQRNALLARIRHGHASTSALPAWDAEVARHGIALMEDRTLAVGALADRFALTASALGLDGSPRVSYRRRSPAGSAAELAAEMAQHTASDIERGFTGHGPHRDDLRLEREGRELRTYASQGQQRLGLLALLISERDAIAQTREAAPILLLDDVTSELDGDRRERLVGLVGARGQAIITATAPEAVPASEHDRIEVAVPGGVAGHARSAAAA